MDLAGVVWEITWGGAWGKRQLCRSWCSVENKYDAPVDLMGLFRFRRVEHVYRTKRRYRGRMSVLLLKV